MANEKKLHLFMRRFLSPVIRFNRNDKICGVCTLYREGDFIHTDSPHVFSISFAFSPGVQNWLGLTEKFQALKNLPAENSKICLRQFFQCCDSCSVFFSFPPSSFRRLRRLEFCPRIFTDGFAFWIFPPTGSLIGASGAKKLQLYLPRLEN